MLLGVGHEIDLIFESGLLAKVHVPHFVMGLEYLQNFFPSVFEYAADLYRLKPVFRVVDHSFLYCETWDWTQSDRRLLTPSSLRWTVVIVLVGSLYIRFLLMVRSSPAVVRPVRSSCASTVCIAR